METIKQAMIDAAHTRSSHSGENPAEELMQLLIGCGAVVAIVPDEVLEGTVNRIINGGEDA